MKGAGLCGAAARFGRVSAGIRIKFVKILKKKLIYCGTERYIDTVGYILPYVGGYGHSRRLVGTSRVGACPERLRSKTDKCGRCFKHRVNIYV